MNSWARAGWARCIEPGTGSSGRDVAIKVLPSMGEGVSNPRRALQEYGCRVARSLATNENNEVVVMEEVGDVAAMMESLNSPETIEAMESDGVKRDFVKIFILDKEFSF